MRTLGRAWTLATRARRRLRPAAEIDYKGVIRTYAPGRSFADVGCMWQIHGELAFVAEDAGASAVTGVDVMKPSEEFERKHRERSSRVRYVRADAHHDDAAEAVGVHDVVWCTGVLYHSPHPMRLLRHLSEMTGELLIIGSATMPEVPGLAQALVFYPGLGDEDRALHDSLIAGFAPGVTTPFDGSNPYANWWWGITPSAMSAMVERVGLSVAETHQSEFLTLIVARK